jgi:hypothetical protein
MQDIIGFFQIFMMIAPQTLAGAFSGEWRFARIWVELS